MMNGMNGLPGIEGLFRENKRLAAKLTSDEVRAIRDYIEDRVRHEQATINFRLYALQNDFDVTVRRSSETINDLHQELSEKKETIKQYQASDEKIISVYKQKEQRWEKKQEMLMAEVTKTEGECAKTKMRLEEVEKELETKTGENSGLQTKLNKANEAVKLVGQAKIILNDNDKMKQDLLKLKMDMDRKDKQIGNLEKEKLSLNNEIDRLKKERQMNDLKITNMQKELRKHVSEIAEKCKSLSELQFQLQLEKRQAETLQKELRKATEDMENYKNILIEERKALNPNNAALVTLRKDLEIMDIRIKSLDIGVRLRMDEHKRIEDRIDDLQVELKLAVQLKNEIYLQGETYLELTSSELVKKLEFKHKRLLDELKYAKDWDIPKRDADTLRAEITALMKQAAICKATEVTSRAAKQMQKIDLIMRGTGDSRMPKIYKVSERNSQRQQGKSKPHAFISASTPISGFENSTKTQSIRSRKRMPAIKGRQSRNVPLDNYTDDSKLQYIDTVELDLSRVSSATPRVYANPGGNQSDRLTLKSVSTSNLDTHVS